MIKDDKEYLPNVMYRVTMVSDTILRCDLMDKINKIIGVRFTVKIFPEKVKTSKKCSRILYGFAVGIPA